MEHESIADGISIIYGMFIFSPMRRIQSGSNMRSFDVLRLNFPQIINGFISLLVNSIEQHNLSGKYVVLQGLRFF